MTAGLSLSFPLLQSDGRTGSETHNLVETIFHGATVGRFNVENLHHVFECVNIVQ